MDNENEIEYENGFLGSVLPRKGTEARAVYDQVKAIKNLAKEKGVDDLICHLYKYNIEHYPAYFNRSDCKKYIPLLVTSAIKKEEENNKIKKEIIEITLNNKFYKFEYSLSQKSSSHSKDKYITYYLLNLFDSSKKLLSIIVNEETTYDTEHPLGSYTVWEHGDIEGYIDGDWISDFELLQKQIKEMEQKRQMEEAENAEKTNKLKQDFGLN